MKIKDDFMVVEVGDNYVAVSGKSHIMIRMNGTAAFILKKLQKETTREALIDALEEEYEGTRERFAAGVDNVLSQLRGSGILEE